ncbi:MAG: glycosyltransferase [Rhodospirillum sp.]|nr:glycosyltransferase [Rhodospirillum sp.]MCF8490529.1 glycosyltransferase [Rhodospirillum sp.]MCF8502139.1 glycosyltransferase [Rhodospirillum sp.]
MTKAVPGRTLPCRLCGAATVPRFEGMILGRIPNTWWHCPACECLQTAPPHWLEEAYRPENRAVDTGIVQRNIRLSLTLPVLLSPFGVTTGHRWLDQGGGDGLLCRLMRDRGFDAWRHDPFCPNHFAIGFDKADARPGPWPIVTLFEVLEHLPNPAEDLAELEALDADVIIATTTPYTRQASGWPYLTPEIGQHVFFWSIKGLDILAQRLGMRLVTVDEIHVLIRPEPKYLSYDGMAVLETGQALRNPGKVLELGLNAFASHLPNGFNQAMVDSAKCIADLDAHRGTTRPIPVPLTRRPAIQVADQRPRVLVDGIFFQHMVTGIGRYWESVLREWGKTEFGGGVTLLDRMGTGPRIPGVGHRIIGPHAFGDWQGEAARLQDICDEEKADVFFSTYYTGPSRTPSAMVVYDMIPERLGHDLEQPMWRDKALAIGRAARHVCISRATRSDLVALHGLDPMGIPIAYPGVDHGVFHSPDPEEAERVARGLYLPDRYVLMVGSPHGYKNGGVLFEALRDDPELSKIPVIVACKQGRLQDEDRANARGLTVLAHHFTDPELRVVYARATALVVPSLLEGFSMPLAEGAACGCPVLCSDIPLFREVLGEAAIFFDPRRPDSLRGALRQGLDGSGADVRRTLGIQQATLYTWSDCAEVLEGVARDLFIQKGRV